MNVRGIDHLVDSALEAMQEGNQVRALAMLDQVAASDPYNAEVRWLRAKALLETNNFQGALSEANAAIELDANCPDAHHILSCAAWQIGRTALAQRAFDRTAELAPNDVEVHINYARFLTESGNPSVGREVALQAVRMDESLCAAWVALAAAQFDLGKPLDAENSCRLSLKLDPNDVQAQSMMMEVLLAKGDTANADALAHLMEGIPTAQRFVLGSRSVDDESQRLSESQRHSGDQPSTTDAHVSTGELTHRRPDRVTRSDARFFHVLITMMLIAVTVLTFLSLPFGAASLIVLVPGTLTLYSGWRLVRGFRQQ